MENNICKFLPNTDTLKNINILHFVYETEQQSRSSLKLEAFYKIHLVTSGTGKLYKTGSAYPLKASDIFFTFPSDPYAIESGDDFAYLYISYIGIRTNRLMDELNITKKNFLFEHMEELQPFWEKTILDERSILALRCEGILLYTFSILGQQIFLEQNSHQNEDNVLLVKKFIDEHFSDKDLSIELLSKRYSYNPKYLSGLFKKRFHIGISQYIRTLRIQKACTLMEQGFTSIKDISCQCGFHDPFYFSKIFKENTGLSPKEHLMKNSKNL